MVYSCGCVISAQTVKINCGPGCLHVSLCMLMSGVQQWDSPFKFRFVSEIWVSCRIRLWVGGFGSHVWTNSLVLLVWRRTWMEVMIMLPFKYWCCRATRENEILSTATCPVGTWKKLQTADEDMSGGTLTSSVNAVDWLWLLKEKQVLKRRALFSWGCDSFWPLL